LEDKRLQYRTYLKFLNNIEKLIETNELYKTYLPLLEDDIQKLKKKIFKDKSVISVSGYSEVIISIILKVITNKIRKDKPSSIPIYINTNWFNSKHPSKFPLTTLIHNIYGLDLSVLIEEQKEIILIVDGSGFLSKKWIYLFLKELAYLKEHGSIKLIFSNLETNLRGYQTIAFKRYFVDFIPNPITFLKNNNSGKLSISLSELDEIEDKLIPITYLKNSLGKELQIRNEVNITFIINHLLPYLAYVCFIEDTISFTLKELRKNIAHAATYFYNIHYATAFPELKHELSAIEPRVIFEDPENISKLINRLIANQHFFSKEMLLEENLEESVFCFNDTFFRDFFYCKHIYNAIKVSLLASEDLPKIFKERIFAKKEILLLGTFLNEHEMQPILKQGRGWVLPDNAEQTSLFQLLNYCRDVFNRKYLGWINWNIINIIIQSRKELSGLNLNNLDFYGIDLHGVLCNRKNGSNYLATNFEYSKLYKHNFTERINFIPAKISIHNGLYYLYENRKQHIALLNTYSGHSIHSWQANLLKDHFVIPFSTDKLLIKFKSGRLACFNLADKIWEFEINTPLKGIVNFEFGASQDELYLVDRLGKFAIINLLQQTIKTFSSKKYLKLSCIFKNEVNNDLFIGFKDGQIECLSLGETTSFLGHTSKIVAIAVIQTSTVISADEDGQIMYWNYATKQCIKKLSPINEGVSGLFFKQGETHLKILTRTGRLLLFNANKYVCYATFDLKKDIKYPIKASAYDSKRDMLFMANKLGVFSFYLPTQQIKLISQFETQTTLVDLQCHKEESSFILGYSDNSVKEWIYNDEFLSCIQAFKPEENFTNKPIIGASYQPKTNLLMVIGSKSRINFYKSGFIVEKINLKLPNDSILKTYTNDEFILSVLDRKGKLYQLEQDTFNQIREYTITKNIKKAVFHPFEEKLLLELNNNLVIEWDLLTNTSWHTYTGVHSKIISISYDQSGEKVLIVTNNGKLFTFDRENENIIEISKYPQSKEIGLLTNVSLDNTPKELAHNLAKNFKLREGLNKNNKESKDKYNFIAYELQSKLNKLVTIDQENKISIWDTKVNRLLAQTIDVSGILICGCNMQHLNPTSDMVTQENLLFLEAQGAIISPFDSINENEKGLNLIPQEIHNETE